MVEDDPRIRKRASEVLKLGDLRMVEPGVERETEAVEHREPLAEALVGHESGLRAVGRIEYRCIRVPGCDVADAAKSVASGTHKRRQDRFDPRAQRQIRMADNGSANLGLAVYAARARGGYAVGKLDFSDRAYFLRAGRAPYIERAWTNTVATMLWPLLVSISRSSSR
jgi:hypothetical protein